nr:MAG TPA: tail tape measure [Caudoviricetes sp.]
MANAQFKIDIYGDTARFENSLKGIDSAMSKLKAEASGLRKELKLDPTNTEKMKQLQANLAQQMERTKAKASELKKEMAGIDKSTPEGQKRWLTLQKQLSDNSIKAGYLERDIKQVGEAIARGNWKADIDTKPAQSSLNKVKKSFSALKEIGIGALRSIGSSITGAVGNGLKGWVSDAMSTQKAMLSLQNTMQFKGIGGGFQKLSNEMSKLATDTNANTEDTLKLATTFVGLGDTADVASKKTSNLVKANQAFGGTGENLKGVVQAYGQMSAAGKVTAENINQLTDNNTALGSALKSTVMEMNPALKQFGSFAGASEKGAVTVEMLDKAMEKLGKAGGNQITTIGDAWDSFNETMSLALLPTLQALTPVITALIDKMSDWGKIAGNAISGMVQYVQLLFYELQDNGAIQAFAGVWNNVKVIFGTLMNITGQLIQAFFGVDKATLKNKTSMEQVAITIKAIADKLLDVTAKMAIWLNALSQNQGAMDALKTAIAGLAGAFTAMKIVGVVQKFMFLFKAIKGGIGIIKTFSGIVKTATSFTSFVSGLNKAGGAFKVFGAILSVNPFVALAVAIGVIVGALVFFFTQTKKGREVWANFVEFLKTSWDSVLSFFSGMGSWFSNLWNSIVSGIKTIWSGVVTVFEFYVNTYKTIFMALIEFFTNLWTTITSGISSAWSGVSAFFTTLWNTIATVIQTVWTNVTTFIGTVVQNIMNFFQPLIAFYQSLWNLIFSIINLVLQLILAGVRGLVQGIQALWNGLVGVVQTVWNFILGIVKNVVSAIQSGVQAMGNFINNVWQSILNFFKPIFQAISNFAGQVFQAIGNFASQAWSTVQNVWSVVVSWFSGIFNSVKSTVSGAFNAFGGFARNAWSAITGVFNSVGSWFSGKFNAIKEAVSGVFNTFGGFAQNAWNAITNTFSGVYDFFANAFGGVKDLIDSILGGVTKTINGISSAINGVSKTVSGMFKGSLVSTISDVNLNGANQGLVQNSAVNSDNRTYNTFHINAGNQDATALARAVRREFNQGRA